MLCKRPSDFEADCLSTAPAMTKGLTWCHACCSAQEGHLEMTLKWSFAKLMKYGAFKKCHFTRDIQMGIYSIVKTQPFDLVLNYHEFLSYVGMMLSLDFISCTLVTGWKN